MSNNKEEEELCVDTIALEDEPMNPHQHAGIIAPIEEQSIQRIVAGQAITDLASCVKELLDNALDAGAKCINIRLYDQGLGIVEVSDDGCGVPRASRPYIAMKHATSKIRDFDDIYTAEQPTLGFRGEALFCLAHVCEKLVVATRTADEPIGQQLEFGRDGLVKEDSIYPYNRKIGTTVAAVKLFQTLPVRRADLIKRISAQRQRVLSLVQSYAILCTGVKFNLMDTDVAANEQARLRTTGAASLEQTVSSVLGSCFLSGLCNFQVDLSSVFSSQSKGKSKEKGAWRVEGLVSKAPTLTARDGSVSRELQFFSINKRPVELPKIAKALLEAWRSLEGFNDNNNNGSKKRRKKNRPACVLHFTLPPGSHDVNLSPDKRQVLLREEESICEIIGLSVLEFWKQQQEGNFAPQQAALLPNNDGGSPCSDSSSTGGSPRRVKRRMAFVHDFGKAKLQHDPESVMLQGQIVSPPPFNTLSGSAVSSSEEKKDDHLDDNGASASRFSRHRPNDRERQQWNRIQQSFQQGNHGQQLEIQAIRQQEQSDVRQSQDELVPPAVISASAPPPAQKKTKRTLEDFAFTPLDDSSPSCGKRPRVERRQSSMVERVQRRASSMTERPRVQRRQSTMVERSPSSSPPRPLGTHNTPRKTNDSNEDLVQKQQSPIRQQRQLTLDCGTSHQMETNSQEDQRNEESTGSDNNQDEDKGPLTWGNFRGTEALVEASRKRRLYLEEQRQNLLKISSTRAVDKSQDKNNNNNKMDIDDNDDCDNDKSKVINLQKKDFGGMKIIGQFNLGFILAQCEKNHLWILDQHACDEKYNFERLCQTTVLSEQRLIAPMPLELSPSQEACILDHMDVFESNGFRFQYDADKEPRHRLQLTALPHSGARDGCKAVQFGKDDVTALCALLGGGTNYNFSSQGEGTGADGQGRYGNNAVRRYARAGHHDAKNNKNVMARLPKAIAMFANRACRGSIMIGTALSHKEMQAIVNRLGGVEQPWNCPHGRPTMRHVRDVHRTLKRDVKAALEDIATPTISVVPTTFLTQEDNEED